MLCLTKFLIKEHTYSTRRFEKDFIQIPRAGHDSLTLLVSQVSISGVDAAAVRLPYQHVWRLFFLNQLNEINKARVENLIYENHYFKSLMITLQSNRLYKNQPDNTSSRLCTTRLCTVHSLSTSQFGILSVFG